MVASITLTEARPCVDFRSEPIAFPRTSTTSAAVMVTLSSTTAMVATADGRFFRVSEAGAILLPGIPADTPHHHAFWDPVGGEVWLFTSAGRVAHGHPDRGFVGGPPVPVGSDLIASLDGRREGEPFELFVITSSNAIFHYRDSVWTQRRPASGRSTERTRSRIAWAGDGEAIAIGATHNGILEITPRGVFTESANLTPRSTPEAFFDARFVPGWGPMLGTRYGELWRRQDGVWRPLPTSEATPWVGVITNLDEGLLFGGEKGTLVQYFERYGYCPPVNYGRGDVTELIPLGRNLLSFQDIAPDLGIVAQLLRRSLTL